ncbi:hypothetical protein ABFG93_21545 (plasmid) [Pseudalkalibacillus hwajinpoensis]
MAKNEVTTQSIIALGAGSIVIGALVVFIGEYSKLLQLQSK